MAIPKRRPIGEDSSTIDDAVNRPAGKLLRLPSTNLKHFLLERIAKNPHDVGAYGALAERLTGQARIPYADSIIRNGIENNPEDYRLRLQAAEMAVRLQDYDTAKRVLFGIIREDRHFVDAYIALADIYDKTLVPPIVRHNPDTRYGGEETQEETTEFVLPRRLDRNLKVQQVYRMALKHNPDSIKLHMAMGDFYRRIGDYDMADTKVRDAMLLEREHM